MTLRSLWYAACNLITASINVHSSIKTHSSSSLLFRSNTLIQLIIILMVSLPQFTFITASLFSIGIIGYVFYQQENERKQLHQGVINDLERQRIKELAKLESKKL